MAYNYGGYMPQYQAWPNQPVLNNDYTYRQPVVQQQNTGNFTYVIGIEGAKAFPVSPGQEAFLMDSQEPIAYIKSADLNGRPSLKIYDLVERIDSDKHEEQPKIDMSEYIKKSEIESFVSEAVDKAMSNFTMTPTKSRQGGGSRG